jgi:hypothetical protein
VTYTFNLPVSPERLEAIGMGAAEWSFSKASLTQQSGRSLICQADVGMDVG